MSYLKLQRGQIILASFLLASLLLFQFPGIDISISDLFFDQTFYMKERWWLTLCHEGMVYFLTLSLIAVIGMYAYNVFFKRSVCGVDAKRVCYLLLVLALGPGLIVNVILKDNFGRARPREVQEFGGPRHFTPAFVVSNECTTNCSFSSGEGAGAFFSLALALALTRRRAMLAAATALGVFISFTRIAAGAHFFSDTVVSFFVMLLLADVLFHYVVSPGLVRERVGVPLPAHA